MVSMGVDFLNAANAKMNPRANCRPAHICVKYSTPFALTSTLSKTDCGENHIEKLTPSSINAKKPDTMSIQIGSDLCSVVINKFYLFARTIYAIALVEIVGHDQQ
jgi:hypothetical protein